MSEGNAVIEERALLRRQLDEARAEIDKANDAALSRLDEIARLSAQVDDIRADRDVERRKMAWQLVLQLDADALLSADASADGWAMGAVRRSWAVVDAFLDAERGDEESDQ